MQPDGSLPDDNQPMISGQPQSIMIDPMTGLPQNVIIMQQPSSAPQIVGILVIIYGAITVLASVLGVFGSSILASEVDDSLLNDYATHLMIFSLASVLLSIATIISGIWINNRQTKGVHLAFVATCVYP